MSAPTDDTRYPALIAQAWAGMLALLLAMFIADLVGLAMAVPYQDLARALAADPGRLGLRVLVGLICLNTLVQVAVRTFDSPNFRRAVFWASGAYTAFFMLHQLVHALGGEAIGLHTALDLTHHALGLWACWAARQWVKAGQDGKTGLPRPTDGNGPARIARATGSDAEAISRLLHSLAGAFTLDPDGRGAEGFMRSISPEAIGRCIAAPDFAYFKAEVGGRLAGVVALRDGRHLHHLFVARERQGQGLARALWAHARAQAAAAGPASPFTVNATPGAVPVYERFGFRPTGPRVETMGIAYVPMRLESAATAA